ncbi:hypothetical protein [Cyclobacterium plantarum]|uniref:hypothetical protein n=1 Tax=Cyclobacterium plantarum TaxID=2716263 RepID=UPI003F719626
MAASSGSQLFGGAENEKRIRLDLTAYYLYRAEDRKYGRHIFSPARYLSPL